MSRINTHFTLPVELMPGTPLVTAAVDAQRIADLMNVCVEFKFNDVTCMAFPGGSATALEERVKQLWARSTSPAARIAVS